MSGAGCPPSPGRLGRHRAVKRRPEMTNDDRERPKKQQVSHHAGAADLVGDGRVDLYAGFCRRPGAGRKVQRSAIAATASTSISRSGRNRPATWTSELVGGRSILMNSSRTARTIASAVVSTT